MCRSKFRANQICQSCRLKLLIKHITDERFNRTHHSHFLVSLYKKQKLLVRLYMDFLVALPKKQLFVYTCSTAAMCCFLSPSMCSSFSLWEHNKTKLKTLMKHLCMYMKALTINVVSPDWTCSYRRWQSIWGSVRKVLESIWNLQSLQVSLTIVCFVSIMRLKWQPVELCNNDSYLETYY